jgi:hypothetical protein
MFYLASQSRVCRIICRKSGVWQFAVLFSSKNATQFVIEAQTLPNLSSRRPVDEAEIHDGVPLYQALFQL